MTATRWLAVGVVLTGTVGLTVAKLGTRGTLVPAPAGRVAEGGGGKQGPGLQPTQGSPASRVAEGGGDKQGPGLQPTTGRHGFRVAEGGGGKQGG
jgi:hypothetical protein